jgi:hypothetical protein
MVAVKGMGARLVVESLALNADGTNNAVIDMEVGVSKYERLNVFFKASDGHLPTLAILDANLSALDIYGRQLLDHVLDRITSGAPPYSPILLSLSDSPLAVVIPQHFYRNALIIDLDNFANESESLGQAPLEIKKALLDDHGGILPLLFWPPLAGQLRKYIEKLGASDAELLRNFAALLAHQKKNMSKHKAFPALQHNGVSPTRGISSSEFARDDLKDALARDPFSIDDLPKKEQDNNEAQSTSVSSLASPTARPWHTR